MDSATLWALGIIIFVLLFVTTFLFYLSTSKSDIIQKLQEEYKKLMRSFNDLDEQAKMVVRTDLELNKIHEEMDKRLNGLNALQRISKNMSQALNQEEIFQSISPALFSDLRFARVLIASLDGKDVLKIRLNIGYGDAQAEAILKDIQQDPLKAAWQDNHTLSSLSGSHHMRDRIVGSFEAEYFVLAPIPTQRGSIGFVFAGNRYNAAMVTQGDEELIAILSAQIGQSVENAQLFEKVFRSSQELEIKVADRTKQLAQALQKVNDISKKKSDFVSAVSHELRTPLTSIKGYAAILMAGKIGDVPPAVKERLAKINAHSDNLVSLINNLLDIARIESGRQEMKFSIYNIKHVLDNISDLLGPQMAAKNISLRVNVSSPMENIYADSSQAERVLINLLSNAIKFTPNHGTITVAAAPAPEKGFCLFSVADTGIGIPASEIQKLFSEFFRVDNEINSQVKGTGLGLVLAKNIVQAHGGRLWVESQVGLGTAFYFTLPCSQQALEEGLNFGNNHA